MTGIGDLLVGDPSVAVSTLVVAALIVGVAGRPRPRVPTAMLVMAAVAVSLPFSQANPDRYIENPLPNYPVWVVALCGVAVAAFAAVVIRVANDQDARSDLTVATAGIAAGLFLAIPETSLLRLTPGPLVLVSVGVVASRLPPFGPVGTVLVVGSLAWVATIDGISRNATMLGLATAVGLAAVVPSLLRAADRAGRPAHRGRTIALVAVTAWIVAACRLVGTASSDRVALVYAVLAFAVTGAAGLALRIGRSGTAGAIG